VISVATVFVANPLWSLSIAITAWIVAALNIVGLLDNTIAVLDGAALTLGQVNISVLAVVQGLIALGVLLWITTIAGQVIDGRIKSSPNLTPSIKVLTTKLVRIVLVIAAVIFALKIVGIDLTAFAVVGGAIGVGLGFGLQKIFANLVSGFILLLDKSIKPGDVIAIADYYGRVDSLGARYVSVLTRDGIEHLIPNEELITTRVENWSHTQNLLRIRKTIGIHYKSDVRKAIALCLEAADETPRVLKDPAAVCHLREFADSSVNLEVRFWIDDPMNGRANVVSALQLGIWDKFHEHGIEIPYPQRDIHFRSPLLRSSSDEDPGGTGIAR
jgi:small-conductance mechanosensitive channel